MIKRSIVANFKNVLGWRTSERYLAFAVDDYGSVRLASRGARDKLEKSNSCRMGQMDRFDAVETCEDLQALFEVLRAHKDAAGRVAIFTAFTLCANPDFDYLRKHRAYGHETLLQTFERLSSEQHKAYEGTWAVWKEGISSGLIRPQFHGREHFNVPLLVKKLLDRSADLEANVAVDSMAGLQDDPELPGVGFTHAFGIHDASVLPLQREIINSGLRLFEDIFEFRSVTFTPPAGKLHPSLDGYVHALGVKSIDKPFFGTRPIGNGRNQRSINFLEPPKEGKNGKIVRTLSFEPCSGVKSDPVGEALREIEIAFRWGKPAIISSHRVNYGGHIDPENRKRGLGALSELLQRIKKLWPDIRFVSVDELAEIMEADVSRVQ